MKEQLTSLFTSYLIYPILGLLFIVITAFIAKKNDLLGNRKLITFFLLAVCLLTLPALLGYLRYDFMPVGYAISVALYLVAGYAGVKLLPWILGDRYKYAFEITTIVILTLTAALFYTLLFNYTSDLRYGLWASTSLLAFPLVSLLWRSVELYIDIPSRIYKVWNYNYYTPSGRDIAIDYDKLNVVRLELFKSESDRSPTRINAKAAEDMVFGDWISILIRDYNKKSADSPIIAETGEKDTGWIFYVKPSVLRSKRYIDCELTLAGNRIAPDHLIIARRVKNLREEKEA